MTSSILELKNTRFGDIEFSENDVVVFPKGLVGLVGYRSFVIVTIDEASPFRWLQSCDDAGFAILITDPSIYVLGYAPKPRLRDLEEIGLESIESIDGAPKPFLVVTVTIPEGRPLEMTLNLMGPIVINPESRLATQLVLDDETYTTKHRVFTPSGCKIPAA
jgi:flagellar assembly factor FliW